LEQDLFRKPVSTFPDHALAAEKEPAHTGPFLVFTPFSAYFPVCDTAAPRVMTSSATASFGRTFKKNGSDQNRQR